MTQPQCFDCTKLSSRGQLCCDPRARKFGAFRSAYDTRQDESFCGPTGQWFEAAPPLWVAILQALGIVALLFVGVFGAAFLLLPKP